MEPPADLARKIVPGSRLADLNDAKTAPTISLANALTSPPPGNSPASGQEAAARPNRPMVRYVIASYPSPGGAGRTTAGIGGCELQAHRVARQLTDRFEVRVVTQTLQGLDTTEVLDGVRIDRIRLHADGTVPAALHAGRSVLWGMRAGRPDIVQGFQLNGVTIGAAVLARLRHVPLVIKVADRVNIQVLLPSRLGRAKLGFLMHSASAVVVPSVACLDDLRALEVPEAKLRLVPNGVDTRLFRPASHIERTAARAKLGLSDEDFVFAWVARLDPRKGLDRVSRVWGRLVEIRPQARLVVAGDGQEKGLAVALSHDYPQTVKWLGMVERVQPVHAAADAILIASSSEGLSNTLLEAMAAGVPAVVSAIPENLEVDPEGGFMIPFQRDSPDSMLAALVGMIDRDCVRGDMRAKARARAESQYALTVTAELWADLYHSLVPMAGR